MNVPKLRFKDENGQDFPEWEEKTLEQLASVERGKFSVRPRNDPRYFGGRTPFIQTGDVVAAGLFLKKFSQTLNDAGLKVSRLFPKDTVLITIAANIGDTTVTQFDVACTDSVVAIQAYDKKAHPVWLKLVLDTKKADLDANSSKNAQKNINLQVLKPLILDTPCFREQTKIANFLSAVDDKISEFTKKFELLQRYKKGVMQQIFSQQLRFKDDNGQDFPEWEDEELGDVAERVVRKNKENNQNVLTISAQQGLINQEKFFNKLVAAKDTTGYYLLHNGDFAYNKSYSNGYPMGAIKCLNDYEKGVVSTLYICFRLKGNNLNSFFEHYFESGIHNTEIEKVAKEGARNHGLLNIGLDDFFSIDLKVPSLPEQTKIANFLSALDEQINISQQQLESSKQYKKSLLQQMFI